MSFLDKINSRGIGFLIGVLTPCIAFLLYGLLNAGDVSFQDWVIKIWNHDSLRSNTLTLPLLPNLFFFYLSNFRWRLDHLTIGLVGATLLLSVVVISLIVV